MQIQKIYQDFLTDILVVGSDITSKKYMLMVLNTVIRSYQKSYQFLSNINILDDNIKTDDKINDAEPEKAKAALSEIFRSIREPFDKVGKQSFSGLLQAQINKDLMLVLKGWGLF